jgi:hypothetical protein
MNFDGLEIFGAISSLSIIASFLGSFWGSLMLASLAAYRSEDRVGFEKPVADFCFRAIVWIVVFLFALLISFFFIFLLFGIIDTWFGILP